MTNFEEELIRKRYERRIACNAPNSWSAFRPYSLRVRQERERALVELMNQHLPGAKIDTLRALEVGCGTGNNLLNLLALGFKPENLFGNDLMPEFVKAARKRLPEQLHIYGGDATKINIAPESMDLVFQFVVFTSILDKCFQHELANKMWGWLKNGGAIVWYDFIYNNPNNPDVCGAPLSRVKELFPEGQIHWKRVTLAPPIGRVVVHLHPSLYTLLNLLPFLRTHVVCWIYKKRP